MNKINLNNKDYEIIDAKETITIPDCFVKDPNKIGRGHGEAKFYVNGNSVYNNPYKITVEYTKK